MVTFLTIVLDGQPFIERHYPVFKSLDVPWRWIVVEGVANNVNCTGWCAELPPRLSNDGTTEYLDSIRDDRVTVLRRPLWHGKLEMCNAAMEQIKAPCFLWQVDSDEIWTKAQIETVRSLFQSRAIGFNAAMFRCRYFVGPDIVTLGHDCYGNNTAYEWKRVWQFRPGNRFVSHEPPLFNTPERILPHSVTVSEGCVFDHFAYCLEKQVLFKQQYYAGLKNPVGHLYANAVEGWKRLQENQLWPARLQDFLPWVDNKATVVRLTTPTVGIGSVVCA